LPQYRGAAPINWAIINGEKETGVTTFKLRHEIDTGDILMNESFPIGENETAGEVHEKMKTIGARLLVKTVQGVLQGKLKEIPQTQAAAAPITTGQPDEITVLKHAPKIVTATCRIDFGKTVGEVHNLIRGLSPSPGAFTELDQKMLKIYRSEKETCTPKSLPGQFETDRRTFFKFACPDGYIIVKELQLEGKKRMTVEEFIRGYRFS
jgi:methionyl-tRNA formyltransferase